MAKKKEVKQVPIENTLWAACDKLRSNMSGITYMYFVMGLVFLKFADMKFEVRREELLNSEDAPFVDIASFYTEKGVFYLGEKSRWSTIRDNAKQKKIYIESVENGESIKKEVTLGMLIDIALQELEKDNPELKGALPIGTYAKTNLPQDKFAALIATIDGIHEDSDHPMKDLIGKIYQYFLNKFAIKTADEKGEFYTPDNIVDLITTMIEPYSGKVYDPCCGSGGMFIQSYKFVEAHKGNTKSVSIYGQESNEDTWKLARMNLAIRGIPCNLGSKNADTFSQDQHKNLKADYIIANPPFNLKDWRTEKTLTSDPRWAGYGTPPVSNANYAWILHMLSKLSYNGVAGFLLANGALSDSDTKEIRKNLILNDNIEAIIILPREMFYYTDISVTLWIMRKHKKSCKVTQDDKEVILRDRSGEILLMDLRTKGKKSIDKYIEIDEETRNYVKSIYNAWQSPDYKEKYHDIPEFCKSVSYKDIRNEGKGVELSENESNWSLVPSKHIEFIDHDLDIDFDSEMTKIQAEIKDILIREKKTQDDLEKAFEGIGYGIK